MRSRTRRSALVVGLLGLLSSLFFAVPAAQAAGVPATPGSFSGYAFDACHTPSQKQMDTWLERSPYWGVGVYISGVNRACKNEPNLTAGWMTTQLKKGWKVLPLTVGLQPGCWRYGTSSAPRISTSGANDYANAYNQGVAEANSAFSAAGNLAIPKKSTLWLDVEGFSNPNPKNYPPTAPLIPDPTWQPTIPDPTWTPTIPNPDPQQQVPNPDYPADPTAPSTIPDPTWSPTIPNPVSVQPMVPNPTPQPMVRSYPGPYYDGPSNQSCLNSVVQFVRGWTTQLHQLGYKAGFYSSAASGVTALVNAVRSGIGPMPDGMWFAHWNDQVTAASSYVPSNYWPAQRVHQYSGGHKETYGGVTLNIDSNWVEIGGGTKPSLSPKTCGMKIDTAPLKRTLKKGNSGNDVKTLKCLLKLQGFWKGRITTKYDAATVAAVKKFQKKVGLKATGKAAVGTRTALTLMPKKAKPLLKIGARGASVRRVQRALNVAVKANLPIDGIYTPAVAKAVKKYQKKFKQPQSGVVAANTWSLLARGKY